MFGVKGTKSSLGSDTHLLDEINEDADLVKVLMDKGGIPFVKTNVPVLCFSYHSSNHIFGTGENPWNRGWSIGGSTGGEAGLIAANCSPFGIGSDAGGSMRVPASFCGIVSFMPTPKRVSLYGHWAYTGSHHYQIEPAHICVGPMTRNVDDAKLIFEISLNTQDLNKALVKVPFNNSLFEETQNRKLKVGVLVGIEKLHGLCPSVIWAQKEVS